MEKHNIIIRGLANIVWILRHHIFVDVLSIFTIIESFMGIISYILSIHAPFYLSLTTSLAHFGTPSDSILVNFLLINTIIWGTVLVLSAIGFGMAFLVIGLGHCIAYLGSNVRDAYLQKKLRKENRL